MKNSESGKSIGGLLKAMLFVMFLCSCAYALYFFGTEKNNMQKTIEALEHINHKMRENFIGFGSYPSAEIIKTYQITPENMLVGGAQEYFWRHPFGGSMIISGVFEYNLGAERSQSSEYNVIFNNLSRRHCVLLSSNDWRENENFVGLRAYGFGILASGAAGNVMNKVRLLTEEEAKEACSCEYGSYCSVVLVYK